MRRSLLLVTAPLVFLACRSKGPTTGHETLDSTAAALRSAFNADTGKVRVLMLVSPT
jgi:hypothetical protein